MKRWDMLRSVSKQNLSWRASARASVRAVGHSSTVRRGFLAQSCVLRPCLLNVGLFFPRNNNRSFGVERKMLACCFTAGGGLVSVEYNEGGPAPWSELKHYILSLEHLYIIISKVRWKYFYPSQLHLLTGAADLVSPCFSYLHRDNYSGRRC